MPDDDRIAIGPAAARELFAPAVEAGGGKVVPPGSASALLWASPDDPGGLRDLLEEHGAHLRWVQLPWAGIEPYVGMLGAGPAAERRVWTCAKGVYARPVAELALTLALACMRGIDHYARAKSWRQHGEMGVNLGGAAVTVLGGGGITTELISMLAPFGCEVTVVRNRPTPIEGAGRVLGSSPEELAGALRGADLVVLALALTPDTTGIIDARSLGLMQPEAVLVNVARGPHVVTGDLVAALREGRIRAAGLDVTDPEPLPDGHPLWDLPNCIVTPHVGNTSEMAMPLLAERITSNVARWIRGDELMGPVDPGLGY